LKSRLRAKAERGVRVYFLYDEIGCHSLPSRYIKELREAGVQIHPFGTTQGRGNRFQLNFRNHRKITVMDGKIGYVGGHNVGDEYVGRSRKFGHWRDTHLRIDGPSVRHLQMSFLLDWYFAARGFIPVNWDAAACHPEGTDLLILGSGPADPMDTCSLMFVLAIQMARERIWIASPYFIPNQAIAAALRIAALRGVDVRIMLPLKPDHRVVYMAGFSYMAELAKPNIRFFRYEPGFLHQKAFVVDERLATVGTANVDNRSFSLNFEISALSITQDFVQQVARMLESDFSNCREVPANEGFTRGFLFDSGVRLAHLFSPIL
jgi:cardiolipin synthase